MKLGQATSKAFASLKMKSRIWISYDLGVRGDYEGMYVFLDSLEAKECGDSTSSCVFPYSKDLLAELKAAIKKHVTLSSSRARVYVIYPSPGGKYKGKFLFGRRRAPVWAGYSGQGSDEEDEGD
jgi:hypothetical protein